MVRINDDFWPDDISEELKKPVTFSFGEVEYKTYNIECEGDFFTNIFATDGSPVEYTYYMLPINPTGVGTDSILFYLQIPGDSDMTLVTSQNYEPYENIRFTISMPQ